MKSCKHVFFILFAVSLAGCGGGSPADQAAEEVLDITKEMKSMSADPANAMKAMELLPKMMEAAAKLKQEIEKMSPEEQAAFKAKWESKFKELDGDTPF